MKHNTLKKAGVILSALLPLLFSMLQGPVSAQTIPADSIYFGQTPPGNTPTVFAPGIVSVTGRNIPCITFSPDGQTVCFYVAFWPNPGTPYSMISEYKNNRWSAPAVAPFATGRSSGEPAFAYNGNRIYLFASGVINQVGILDISYVERSGSGWSDPKSLGSPLNSSQDQYHPCVVGDSSVYYSTTSGEIARCQYQNGSYKPRVVLPFPINNANTSQSWGDPYVSPDESYLIFKSNRAGGYGLNDIYIAYRKADGSWTNPKNLGSKINTPFAETAGDITPDGKYMTFNSNQTLYWVSASFIDSLRQTNFIPYLKTKVNNQTGKAGEPFTFTIPDSTFIDDDGNETMTIYVTSRLPAGLDYDPETRIISGFATETGTFTVNLKAIDESNASASASFTLKINIASSINEVLVDQDVLVYPNPARDKINISFNSTGSERAVLTITDVVGKKIFSGFINAVATETIDLHGNAGGMYFMRLDLKGVSIHKRFILE